MARNFKISFPLPRRPSASPSTTTPGSQFSERSNHDDSPVLHPGSKAERTLGASEPDLIEKRKKPSRKEKKQLRKYPSFMSVTLSEVDGESAPDGFPFPGMQRPTESPRLPAQGPNRQGSSPLLGELYSHGAATGDNVGIAPDSQARRAGSSSTLRSHYDPAKVPLPISQQTSASSARDMALRKGFPPISPPSERVNDKTVELGKLHLRTGSGDSKLSAISRLSGNSIKRINGTPRQRPLTSDPPTLHPNVERFCHAVSPPPALINSSLPKPLSPLVPPARMKWWQRKTSSPEISPPIPTNDPQSQDSFEDNFSSIKVNVKKPKTGVKGARNWFDDLEDEEQTLEDLQHPETVRQPVLVKSAAPPSIYEIMSQEGRSLQHSQRKSSFSSKSQVGSSGRKLSFRFDSSSERIHLARPSPPNCPRSMPSSPEAKSIQSASSTKGAYAGIDLHVQSFLELSSSEDEGTEHKAPSEAHEPYRRHQIRASIERNSYNSEVSVSSAQRAQPVRPRSIVNKVQGRPLSKRSNSSEYIPPVPRIPDRPQLSQRSSSVRWREMMEEKAASTESTIDSGASSLNGHAKTRKSQSPRAKKKLSVRGGKLMKVTSEEEKLLEAMRGKRADLRQDDFEKGFKSAMQLQDIVARPKTAGADGRTSSSSMFGSRSSISTSSQEYGIQKHTPGSHLSASVDDLALEDSYPFPEVPSRESRDRFLSRERVPPNLKSTTGLTSPPRASPSLSFSPSDILPSTPTSRNSPLTPPPGHGSLGFYSRSSTLSPPRGIMAMNKIGHDRKRTVSSSVVMLDGVEQHAQELDEENEITGWAMDRW